ncbi:MAG TPA: papain-like cysteine protease family protein [Thermoleophilia bacterium]|nr:papain-like cysteine protease family protein [Thermoleophilia bacterium]
MRSRRSRFVLLLTCMLFTLLAVAPAAGARPKSGDISYRHLTAKSHRLRPFTLLGYISGDRMNLRKVAPRAKVYRVVNAARHTFAYEGTVANRTVKARLIGQYVELWDTNGNAVVDRILVVPRARSRVYWNADMCWLRGVGAHTEPAVDDATGEALYSKEYRIPMGERQLRGYGIGSWSGVTDFSNLADETYWPFIDYYHATSSDRLTTLTGYRTSLQATGGTCGMASALSALDWFDLRRDLNEKDLIALRRPNTRWGGFTSLAQLVSVFQNAAKTHITPAWDLQSSFDDPDALFDPAWVKSTLAGGSPIMVGWNSFGPHWQVIIGYDDMGTEGTNDDVLIMMDPYDSTDHENDGYTIQSYERLAYGVGFEDVDPSPDGEFWHTSYLVATPVDWHWDPVMGEGIPDDPTNVGDFSDDHKIPYGDAAADLALYYPDTPWIGDNGLAGAATGGYERSGDHDFSPYFRFFDWYDMASTDSLTLLEGFRTTQQVTEWTCGPASLLMVRDWFDMNDEALTEIDLAQMRPDPTPGPTLVDDLTTVIGTLNSDYGEDWVYFDMRQYEAAGGWVGDLIPEVLSHGIPMMIAWDEWGGHWQVIIGYDDMGTSQTQDDVLVLADAYDTNDHNQDGYFLESYERLVYGWTFRMGEDGSFVVAYPESQFPDLDFLSTK